MSIQAAVPWVVRTPESTVLIAHRAPAGNSPPSTPHGGPRPVPACLASWAEIRSPVRTISMARDFPTARVSLWVPPAPAGAEGCGSQRAVVSISQHAQTQFGGAEDGSVRWGEAASRGEAGDPRNPGRPTFHAQCPPPPGTSVPT